MASEDVKELLEIRKNIDDFLLLMPALDDTPKDVQDFISEEGAVGEFVSYMAIAFDAAIKDDTKLEQALKDTEINMPSSTKKREEGTDLERLAELVLHQVPLLMKKWTVLATAKFLQAAEAWGEKEIQGVQIGLKEEGDALIAAGEKLTLFIETDLSYALKKLKKLKKLKPELKPDVESQKLEDLELLKKALYMPREKFSSSREKDLLTPIAKKLKLLDKKLTHAYRLIATSNLPQTEQTMNTVNTVVPQEEIVGATEEFLKAVEVLAEKSHKVGVKGELVDALILEGRKLIPHIENELQEALKVLDPKAREEIEAIALINQSGLVFMTRGSIRKKEDELIEVAKELQLLDEKLTAAYRKIDTMLEAPVEYNILTLNERREQRVIVEEGDTEAEVKPGQDQHLKRVVMPSVHMLQKTGKTAQTVQKVEHGTVRVNKLASSKGMAVMGDATEKTLQADVVHPYPAKTTVEQQGAIVKGTATASVRRMGKVTPVPVGELEIPVTQGSQVYKQEKGGHLRSDTSQAAIIWQGVKVQQADVVHPTRSVSETIEPIVTKGTATTSALQTGQITPAKPELTFEEILESQTPIWRLGAPGQEELIKIILELQLENKLYQAERSAKPDFEKPGFELLGFRMTADTQKKIKAVEKRDIQLKALAERLFFVQDPKDMIKIERDFKEMINKDLLADKEAHGVFSSTGKVREKLNEALTKIEDFEEVYPDFKELSRREQKHQKILQAALTEGQHAIKGKAQFNEFGNILKKFQEQVNSAKTMAELTLVQEELKKAGPSYSGFEVNPTIEKQKIQILQKMLKQIDSGNKKLDKEYAPSKAKGRPGANK